MRLADLLRAERARQRRLLWAASALAALGGACAVLLLGLSGWFIAACSLAAGVAGFNYMLPSALIRLLTILRTAARHFERLTGHDAALRILARLRPALFTALAAAPAQRALSLATGDATQRLVGDIDAIETELVRGPARLGALAAWATGGLLAVRAAGWQGLVLCLIPALVWISARHLARRAEAAGAAVPQAGAGLRDEAAALLAARSELRAYGLESWAAARLERSGQTLAQAQARAIEAWSEPLLLAGAALATLAGLVAARNLSVPLAALTALAAGMSVDAVGAHVRLLRGRGQVRQAGARIDAVLADADADAPAPPAAPAPIGARPVLAIPSLGVRLVPGVLAGLHGPSGTGKTRLLLTMVRLIDDGPTITLDGTDTRHLPARTVRGCFALAAQEAPALAGTIRDNLRLADGAADEDALWQALADACLAERVRALPGGLDHWLGEDGAGISGGERRRLTLARAYLRPAPFLLLDEPTEGLDAATEAMVITRLRQRLARTGQGAILVSHRPAPLTVCDFTFTLAAPAVAAL